jgi:hypothetical protein
MLYNLAVVKHKKLYKAVIGIQKVFGNVGKRQLLKALLMEMIVISFPSNHFPANCNSKKRHIPA